MKDDLGNEIKTKKGWVNIHIDLYNQHLYISNIPYNSLGEANKGILIGSSIRKVGCFEIEYDYIFKKIK